MENRNENILTRTASRLRSGFLRLNIAAKIMLAYVPILVLLVLVSTVTLGTLRKLNRLNASILENDVVVRDTATRMIRNVIDQEYLLRRYLLLKTPDILDAYRARTTGFTSLAMRMRQLPEGDRYPVDRIVEAHGAYTTLLLEGMEKLGDPDSGEGRAFLARVKAGQDRLIGMLRKVRQQAAVSQNNKNGLIARIGSSAFRTANTICLVGVLLCLTGAALVTGNISGAVRKLKKATRAISRGDFSYEPDIGNRDELGDLAESFSEMARRLRQLEEMYLDASPLTRLPGGVAIENILRKRIAAGESFAFCMMDLDNFKSFNDHYGYAKGNELIRMTAATITAAVERAGGEGDFVGHIGGDDFVLITVPERYEEICGLIIAEFDRAAPTLYSDEDRERGYITATSRQGEEMRFPLASISIAVVSSRNRLFTNHIQVGEVAAELKKAAKAQEGSTMVVDQRTDAIRNTATMIPFPGRNKA